MAVLFCRGSAPLPLEDRYGTALLWVSFGGWRFLVDRFVAAGEG